MSREWRGSCSTSSDTNRPARPKKVFGPFSRSFGTLPAAGTGSTGCSSNSDYGPAEIVANDAFADVRNPHQTSRTETPCFRIQDRPDPRSVAAAGSRPERPDRRSLSLRLPQRSNCGWDMRRLTRTILSSLSLPRAARAERHRDSKGLPPNDPSAERVIDHAIAWLGRAQDNSASRDGGVARHFGLVNGWATSYPETTGYIVPTMLEHARRTLSLIHI